MVYVFVLTPLWSCVVSGLSHKAAERSREYAVSFVRGKAEHIVMFIYIYIYMYIYIYIEREIYMCYTYTYMHVYIHAYIPIHIPIPIYIYRERETDIYIYICTLVYACMHVCSYTFHICFTYHI